MTDEEILKAVEQARDEVERHSRQIVAIVNRLGPVIEGENLCDATAAMAALISILLQKAFTDTPARLQALGALVKIMMDHATNLTLLTAGLEWEISLQEMKSDAQH